MPVLLGELRIDGLAVLLLDERLWIEEIHLRRASRHEEENHAFRPRLDHRGAQRERT